MGTALEEMWCNGVILYGWSVDVNKLMTPSHSQNPVAWMTQYILLTLKEITYYVIFNIISCAFYQLNGGKLAFFMILFTKRTQNYVHDDVIRNYLEWPAFNDRRAHEQTHAPATRLCSAFHRSSTVERKRPSCSRPGSTPPHSRHPANRRHSNRCHDNVKK